MAIAAPVGTWLAREPVERGAPPWVLRDPMAADETVGERVRRYRRLRKLTQERLADLAGVDRSYLGKIEVGEVLEPGAETVTRLAAALKVKVRALAEPLGWYVDEAESRTSVADAIAEHNGWDDETKQALLKIIELADAQLAASKPEVPGRKR